MSKNTAKVAQAISLLSDVLSSEVESELNEDTETVDNDEYDELKEQAIDFSKDLADDLSIISDDLERILDSASDADAANVGDWDCLADYEDDDVDAIDNEAEPGNGEVDISDRGETDEPACAADDPLDGRMIDHVGTAVEYSAPAATVGEELERGVAAHQAAAVLSEKNAELEKNNEELTDKIEDFTDTLRAVATQIENLHTAADTFVNEVESL